MSKQNFNLVESEFLERAFVPGELDSSAEDGASSRILFHTVRIVEKLFVASIQRLAEELSCAVARLQVIEVIYCNDAVQKNRRRDRFSAQNLDKLLNRVFSGANFRQESRTGLLDGKQDL